MIRIPEAEFQHRIENIQEKMRERSLDGLMVYGDEYRKENLRYVSNFWPIFERGALFIPKKGVPIYAGAPEGEMYVKEMGVWEDVRNIKEFFCVSVPDAIDYPMATFSSLESIVKETLNGGRILGIVGMHDMPALILDRLRKAKEGISLEDASALLLEMRLIKSKNEIACLREAGRVACEGYKKLIEVAIPGNTERQAAGAAEGVARVAGAETISFTVFGSGSRTATIIGRDTTKTIEDGDMIMAALAVQYEGYTSTVAYPFVAGEPSDEQKRFLRALFETAQVQLAYLRDGQNAGEMVRAVRRVFHEHGLSRYDVYPPLHGIGLAEAESPYPDEKSDFPLKAGMVVNSDISLFGHQAGSNRIEEGFIITPDGYESITPMIRKLCERGV